MVIINKWFLLMDNEWFLIVLFALLIFVYVIFYFFKYDQHIITSNITTLGILGTFVGILIGLWHFDPNNIDGSIPGLLIGLKFSFVTSIIGMIVTILFRTYFMFRIKSRDDDSYLEPIEKLSNSIQKSSKAIIDSTEKLIAKIDQDNNINEQISYWIKGMNNIKSSFTVPEKKLEAVSEELNKIKTHFSEIRNVLKPLNDGIKTLNNQFDFFITLESSIGNTFPNIEKNLKTINSEIKKSSDTYEQLKDSTKTYQTAMTSLIEKSKSIDNVFKSYLEVNKEASSFINSINESTDNLIKKIETHMNESHNTWKSYMNSIKEQNKEINNALLTISGNISQLIGLQNTKTKS